MNILTIAKYTFIRSFRDKKSIINKIIMPIVFIWILGTALSFDFGAINIEPIPTGVINNDTGTHGEYFEEFLQSEDMIEMISIVEIESIDEGNEMLSTRELAAVIVVPEGFSYGIENGEQESIVIYAQSESSFRVSMVNSIVESFISIGNVRVALSTIEDGEVTLETGNMVNYAPINGEGKTPTAMDHYAIAMLIMFSLYGSMYALYSIKREYIGGMGQRLQTTPIPNRHQIIGKLIGLLGVEFTSAMLVIGFTCFVYGVNWGTSLIQIMIITATICIFSITLGMMCAFLGEVDKNKYATSGVLDFCIAIFSFINIILIQLPAGGAVDVLRRVIPTVLAQDLYFTTIYGNGISQAAYQMVVLWGLILIMFGVTIRSSRRWKR